MPARSWGWIVVTPGAVWVACGASDHADDWTDTSTVLEWIAAIHAITSGPDTSVGVCEVVTTNSMISYAINGRLNSTAAPAGVLRLAVAVARMRFAGIETVAAKARRDFSRKCNEPVWSTKWMHSACYGAARIACLRANSGMPMIWPPQVWG